MSETELNIKYICDKTLLDKNDELIPIILEMIKDSYKAGLNQSEIDNTMDIIEENQKLKKQLEEKQNPLKGIFSQVNDDMLLRNCGAMQSEIDTYKNQQKEFIEYLENEKDRLARECSHIYEDSLGRTRLVNEDIFNEVNNILSKYKSIIGGKDE